MFFRIGLKKVSSTKGRQGKMNILENFASRSRTFSSTFDPPTVKTYSLKTLFILLSLTCFCSLLTICSAEKPLIDFQATKPRYSKVGQDVEFIVPAVIGKPANISCITKTIPGLSAKWRKQIETESKWQDLVVFEKCEEKRDEEAIIEEMKWVQKDSGKKKEKSVPQCFIFNVGLADGSRNMTLFFTNLTQSDLGNYSCGYTNYPTNPEHSKTDTIVTLEAAVVRVKREKTQPTLRDPPITYRLPNKTSINIVAFRKFRGGLNSLTVLEGEPAYIYCNLTWPGLNSGYTVRWTKDDVQFEAINSTLTTNATLSMITIESVSLLDRGMYKCMIVDSNQFTVSSFPYQLRIRNKMAALWPFIAICVEVVIICLIILIYEKTKNKAEVAESDTDGSPDQKNVSDNNDGASERLQPKE